MRRLFSKTFWSSLIWRIVPIFWQSLFADPGFVTNYFPFIFMYQVFQGTSEDAALNLIFSKTTGGAAISKAITIYTFDNAMYIELSYDGTNYDDPIEIPAQQFFHFSYAARTARIYNRNVGADATFQFIIWYVISQY